jgi:hypothetical protein
VGAVSHGHGGGAPPSAAAASPVSREEAVKRFVEERARQDDYGDQARPQDFRAGHGLHAGRWEARAGWKPGGAAPVDDPRWRAHEVGLYSLLNSI